MSTTTNLTWQAILVDLLSEPEYRPAPRGMETAENIAGQYTVPMPAYLSLTARRVNVPFMLAEPAWVLSGSNRAADITPFMKAFGNFSDDGVFLRGAYGPKVVDQLGYVVDSLFEDPYSRQAYLSIWRERPGKAKDIACTTGMQFILRPGKVEGTAAQLHCVTTMRSQDIVKGFTYDVFTFSMIANAVRLLLQERLNKLWDGWSKRDKEDTPKSVVDLGDLTVTAGSLHLYAKDFDGSDLLAKARDWRDAAEEDTRIETVVDIVMKAETFTNFIETLYGVAEHCQDLLSLQSK